MPTARELKILAEQGLEAGQAREALLFLRRVLAARPEDVDSWFLVARAVESLAAAEQAALLFSAVALAWSRLGNPVGALAAAKCAVRCGADGAPLFDEITALYSSESNILGKGARPSPPDLSVNAPEERTALPIADLVAITVRAGVEILAKAPMAGRVPAAPFLSGLNFRWFRILAETAVARSYRSGEMIVQEGGTDRSIHLLARGEVGVAKGVGGDDPIVLAILGPGAIFGEMALVTDQPRTASVVARTATDLLEIRKEEIERLILQSPEAAGTLLRFTQDRLIQNILNTNPLFTPFPAEERRKLLGHFEGHDLPPATIIIQEGEEGRGLYIILSGEVAISIHGDSGQPRELARLRAGDTFGEISLVAKCNTTATAATTGQATILFLPREYFWRLLDAVPEIKARFEDLAEKRLQDTQLMKLQDHVVDEDFFADVEEVTEESEEPAEPIVIF